MYREVTPKGIGISDSLSFPSVDLNCTAAIALFDEQVERKAPEIDAAQTIA